MRVEIICNFKIPTSAKTFLSSKINSVSLRRRWNSQKIHFSSSHLSLSHFRHSECISALKYSKKYNWTGRMDSDFGLQYTELQARTDENSTQPVGRGTLKNKINEMKFILSEFILLHSKHWRECSHSLILPLWHAGVLCCQLSTRWYYPGKKQWKELKYVCNLRSVGWIVCDLRRASLVLNEMNFRLVLLQIAEVYSHVENEPPNRSCKNLKISVESFGEINIFLDWRESSRGWVKIPLNNFLVCGMRVSSSLNKISWFLIVGRFFKHFYMHSWRGLNSRSDQHRQSRSGWCVNLRN